MIATTRSVRSLLCVLPMFLLGCGNEQEQAQEPVGQVVEESPAAQTTAPEPADAPAPAGSLVPADADDGGDADRFDQALSQVQQGLALAAALKQAVEDAYDERGSLPEDGAGLDVTTRSLDAPGSSVRFEDGTIVIDYESDDSFPGGTLRLQPVVADAGIRWQCSTDTLPAEYVPEECR